MYDPVHSEKQVLFQKLKWPLYSRSCICICEVKTACSTCTNRANNFSCRFLLACHFMCCYLALASCNFNIILSTNNLLRISDTNSLCARFGILTVKLMEDYAALRNDTGLSIYIWVTAFQRGFFLEHRGRMLYWNVATSVPTYTCNIPEDWQLSHVVSNILYVYNVHCDAHNAKCCICSCAALLDGVLI